jgi:hypothetical protein
MLDKPRGMCEGVKRRKNNCGEVEMTGPVLHVGTFIFNAVYKYIVLS